MSLEIEKVRGPPSNRFPDLDPRGDPSGFSATHAITDEIKRSAESYCLDPDKRCTWEHTFGGAREDKLYGLVASPDDSVVAVGNSRSFGGDDYDAVVLKLNRAGEVLWTRRLGGRDIDQVYGTTLDTGAKMGAPKVGVTS